MHVIVLGAGVIGVTTAYYLAQVGIDVTVVDRHGDVSHGTSHANGGQLSYSFTDALAKPEFFSQMPGLLLGNDPGSRLRIDAQLLGWGVRFLAQCTSRRAANNTIALLKLAMRSAELMAQLRETIPLDFSYRRAGKLILLANDKELKSAQKSRELKYANGCQTNILTPAEAAAIEPAIEDLNESFVAATYASNDGVADARQFTTGLRDHLEMSQLANFRFDSEVRALQTERHAFKAINLGDEVIEADAIVVCAGAHSAELLRPLGIRLPIFPVRGYSVTLPTAAASPSVSITALRRRLLIARLGNTMRISGFADFVGDNTHADRERIQALLQLAESVAPSAANYTAADVKPWAADRPMTPTGLPYVGPSSIKNLYLNAGHGMLGWTLANASGDQIARCMTK